MDAISKSKLISDLNFRLNNSIWVEPSIRIVIRCALEQRRRLCGGSRAQAPSEIILRRLSPHRNFTCLLNNIHIYICTHTSICIYITEIAVRAPPEIFQSRRLCLSVFLYWQEVKKNSHICAITLFREAFLQIF